MEEREALLVQLEDTLTLQQKIRLFAMTNLTEDNPFRPLIEEQTCRSASELRTILERLKKQEPQLSRQSS